LIVDILDDFITEKPSQASNQASWIWIITKKCVLFRWYLLAYLAKTINLPFLADSINEGTVAKFLKS